MCEKVMDVRIQLKGGFSDIYEHNKPEGMSDTSYLNAIVSSWLLDTTKKT